MTTTTTTSQQQPPPEAKLLDKFSDGITALQYLTKGTSINNNNGDGDDDGSGDNTNTTLLLLSSSWDGAIRLHDTKKKTGGTTTTTMVLCHNMECGPLLSVTAASSESSDNNDVILIAGGLDGSIKALDVATSTVRTIGKHYSDHSSSSSGDDGVGPDNNNNNNGLHNSSVSNACSCLAAMNGQYPYLIASASWNRQLCLWDLRKQQQQIGGADDGPLVPKPVAQITLPGKAFAMDVDSSRGRIVVATSGRRNCVFDVKMGTTTTTNNDDDGTDSVNLVPILDAESSLKFQTRCVRFFPDGRGFCVGSIEGRVGVEFFPDELGVDNGGMKKYAFKCHRVGETVYPVNVLTFHPVYTSTFATGGCDGTVVLWDGEHKKKLTSLPSFPTSISAIAFSPDGTEIAIASSYTHEEGDRDHPQDELYIRRILDSEVMPKSK